MRRRAAALALAGLGTISPASVPNSVAVSGSGPWNVALSDDGASLYTANSANNAIGQYSRNAATGELTSLGTPVSAGGSGRAPRYIVVANNGTADGNAGKFVYAPNLSNSDIGVYPRNTSTGALSAGSFKACSAGPFGVAMSPDGGFLYVSHSSGSIVSQFSINRSTGVLTALSPATVAGPTTGQGIVVAPDGLSVYVAGNGGVIGQYARDNSTGLLTAIGTGTVTNSGWPADLVVSPDNKHVYVANDTGATIGLWVRDLVTTYGSLGSNATQGTVNGPFGIAISPDGNHVYMPGSDGAYVSQWTRNSSTGVLTKKTPFLVLADSTVSSVTSSNSGPYGCKVSPDGLHLYVAMAGAPNRIAIFNIHA